MRIKHTMIHTEPSLDPLINFNLNQYIFFSTHDSGHIIDLIITNVSSKLVIYPNLIDTRISDHKNFYIDLDI